MKVIRTIVAEVNACSECPYFLSHPHEPSCMKLAETEEGKKDAYYSVVAPGWRNEIDKRCPFL